MKMSMLWDLSVHNMSLPFDHTCCLDKSDLETCLHFPVSENRSRKLRSGSSFLFPVPPRVQFDVVHRHLDLRHKAAHQLLQTACPETSCCCCFSLLIGFFGFVQILGISAFKGSSSSSFPVSTSARDSPTGSMSSPSGATSRIRVFVGLTSALLCHPRFPSADSSSQNNDQHRSHCWLLADFISIQADIENVVFEMDWNEFVLSNSPIPQNEVSFPDPFCSESES